MRQEHPGEWREEREEGRAPASERFVSVLSEKETRVHPTLRGVAWGVAALVFVVVNLVLLIACMNLASMLLARGVARRGEMAVRLALGARRSRIVRQLLTESVLLSVIAGAAGIVLAYWALDALIAFMPALPEGIRVAIDIALDWRVVAYTIAFSTLTGILFGFAPALASSRSAVSSVLKVDAAVFSAPFRASLVRRSLIVAQVAFSLLLLIGAGLMLRSLEKVRPTRMGFTSENLVVAPLALDDAAYTRETAHRFYQDLSSAVSRLPGVQAVSLVEGMPGGFMSRSRSSTEIEGYQPRAGESLEIDVNTVGPRYFTNMKVPVVLGRDFDDRDRDGAPCSAIINEVFARRYLSGSAHALGKHLARPGVGPNAPKRWCEIVGVIRDNAWQSLQREARPFYVLPLLQSDRRRMTLLVSTAGDPAILVPAVRRSMLAIDPNMPVGDVQTLAGHFSVGLYPFRLLGLVFAGCGLMALLLATIGIYGTVAYSVAQRRREVGIRMALGAVRTDILRLVVRQGITLVSYGLVLGLLLGAALTRVLTALPLDTPLLFGVSATDVATFAGVTLLLGLVALTACYVPARRATKVDPVVTLRSS
jgi:predicted permease